MENIGNTVAFIPVRGGSKSIPLKNIKLMNGRPLLYWVLDSADRCNGIDKIIVSTDCGQIAEAAKAFGSDKLIVTGRSEEVSTDTASTESTMLEFARSYDFETIVLIQATSPLLRKEDLDEGLSRFSQDGVDSVLSAVRQKRFIWTDDRGSVNPLNYDPLNRPRRQEFDGYLVENGAFYITSRTGLLQSGCRISGSITAVEMPEPSYFEIDDPEDWLIAEHLLARQQRKSTALEERLSRIRCVLTDCDGVLTDGGMYYAESGDELKKFNTQDGMGFQRLREKGIITGIITGEDVELVKRRAKKLKVDELHMGIRNKLQTLREICDRRNLSLDRILYIGDDINDMETIRAVGVGCAVINAGKSVKEAADYVTMARGGAGAFREVAELVLSGEKSGVSSGYRDISGDTNK